MIILPLPQTSEDFVISLPGQPLVFLEMRLTEDGGQSAKTVAPGLSLSFKSTFSLQFHQNYYISLSINMASAASTPGKHSTTVTLQIFVSLDFRTLVCPVTSFSGRFKKSH